ncbi:hypothetical protein HOY82DRAFT_616380 [Tuber indicum]|nr:hypothetical protein HOY82DRAFT_616380 [Tuber indicum]
MTASFKFDDSGSVAAHRTRPLLTTSDLPVVITASLFQGIISSSGTTQHLQKSKSRSQISTPVHEKTPSLISTSVLQKTPSLISTSVLQKTRSPISTTILQTTQSLISTSMFQTTQLVKLTRIPQVTELPISSSAFKPTYRMRPTSVPHGTLATTYMMRTSYFPPEMRILITTSSLIATSSLIDSSVGVGNSTVRTGVETPNSDPKPEQTLDITGWGFGNSDFRWTTCLSDYDHYLDNSTEMDKWASAVATTLMTVLPSLIAFSPLKTADIQTLYYLDVVVALITCGFTLFFRVDSWTTLQKDKIWSVTNILDKTDIDIIYCHKRAQGKDHGRPDCVFPTQSSSLNAIRTSTGVAPDGSSLVPLLEVEIDSPKLKRLYERGRLEKLQQDAFGGGLLPDEVESGSVTSTGTQDRRNEELERPRPLRIIVYMVITAFCLFQFFLFLVISCWIFRIDSTLFIWSCAERGYAIFLGWVAASFIVAAVVRYASSSLWMRADEIFHIESIPTTPDCCGENASALFSNPIQERNSHSNWGWIKLAHFWSNLTQLPRWRKLPCLFQITFRTFSIEWERLTRPHPMVLVIRPSRDSCKQRITTRWLSGYLQVIHLGGVSFLFGSIALSSLFLTLGFVATFVSAVAFSRLASIQLCAWLEKRLGLTIIEYRTEREWVAIWFVLNSMPGCLVESKNSSYRYANGYRPHLCPEDEGDSGTATGTRVQGQGNIPMPNTDMLKTTVQVPDIKTICTFCSVILGFVLAATMGVLSGIVGSYALVRDFSIGVASIFGGTVGTLSFVFLVWRLWTEFESAAGYGQALNWARGFNPTK